MINGKIKKIISVTFAGILSFCLVPETSAAPEFIERLNYIKQIRNSENHSNLEYMYTEILKLIIQSSESVEELDDIRNELIDPMSTVNMSDEEQYYFDCCFSCYQIHRILLGSIIFTTEVFPVITFENEWIIQKIEEMTKCIDDLFQIRDELATSESHGSFNGVLLGSMDTLEVGLRNQVISFSKYL